jgi:NAD(P)-dependent dehydrogenase (short-subunit alcohol dehydrogenase family)
MRLRDKTAIVTGAGSGIGRAIARMFAAQGARVLVADMAVDGGQATVSQITGEGGTARFIQTDVARAESVQAMVAAALDAWGRLDILVNNAGIVRVGSVTEGSEADWDLSLAVNLKGVYLCARHALPAMIVGGGGAMVNIASVGGLVGAAGLAAYASAKAGVLNLTRQMAVDYGPQGVRVNSICPGTIPTPMHYAFYRPEDKEATLAEWAKAKPLRKVGRPEDIAYAAVYLASDEASFVTGANLVVDGGTLAAGG